MKSGFQIGNNRTGTRVHILALLAVRVTNIVIRNIVRHHGKLSGLHSGVQKARPHIL
jgi:hypothetical protein